MTNPNDFWLAELARLRRERPITDADRHRAADALLDALAAAEAARLNDALGPPPPLT
jgi:hypothetical protein